MTPEIVTLIQTFPPFLSFIFVLGVLAGSLIAILQLWRMIKPSNSNEFASLREELSRDIKGLKDKFDHDIDDVYEKVDELSSRALKIERDIAAIDISQINNRFDRMENKIDDLTALLIQRFSQNKKL